MLSARQKLLVHAKQSAMDALETTVLHLLIA